MLALFIPMQGTQTPCLEVVRNGWTLFHSLGQRMLREYFVPTQSKSHLKEFIPTTAMIPLASKYHECDPIPHYEITIYLDYKKKEKQPSENYFSN